MRLLAEKYLEINAESPRTVNRSRTTNAELVSFIHFSGLLNLLYGTEGSIRK